MPTLSIREPNQVPAPRQAPKAVRELQELYEGFIRSLDGNVGELALSGDEQVRSVKVRLRRAATRLGTDLEIWDHAGNVYFKVATKKGRPRKAS